MKDAHFWIKIKIQRVPLLVLLNSPVTYAFQNNSNSLLRGVLSLRFPVNVMFGLQRNKRSFILTFQHAGFYPKNRSVGTPGLREGFVKLLLVKDSRKLCGSERGMEEGRALFGFLNCRRFIPSQRGVTRPE